MQSRKIGVTGHEMDGKFTSEMLGGSMLGGSVLGTLADRA